MRPTLSAAALAAALVFAGSAGAQQATAAADSSGASTQVRWGLAAGIHKASGLDDAPFGVLHVSWRRDASGFGARAELVYEGERSELTDFMCTGCTSRSARDVAGVSLGGSYEFRRDRRVRPYLFSGAGLYHSWARSSTNVGCAEPGAIACTRPEAGAMQRWTGGSFDLGLHAGLGIAVRLGSIDLTTEVRSQVVSPFYGRQMPITVGIRF